MLRYQVCATVLCLTVGVWPGVAGAADYYVSNKAEAGAGTKENPFGMPDLISKDKVRPERQPGKALAVLMPGDTLWFKGGEYAFKTVRGRGYIGVIRAVRSGEPGKPISFRACPGERVVLAHLEGRQPLVGTYQTDYVRFEGFVLDIQDPAGDVARPAMIYGKGIELAYCELITNYSEKANGKNPAAIKPERSDSVWIHHCILRAKNKGWGHGIEVYTSQNMVVEDNWIYGHQNGLYDKDSGINNTYRRNLVTGNRRFAFRGNNQGKPMKVKIYDNVLEGLIDLCIIGDGTEIHDNLIRANRVSAIARVWNSRIWNNIMVAKTERIMAYAVTHELFVAEGAKKHLEYMDYNVYTKPPFYEFGRYSKKPKQIFGLEEMRTKGFEKNSRVVEGPGKIFVDDKSYKLLPKWAKAGRDGTAPGPEDIALILDTTRYGPEARDRKEAKK